jgi:uncharacterized protein (DUF2147 family)
LRTYGALAAIAVSLLSATSFAASPDQAAGDAGTWRLAATDPAQIVGDWVDAEGDTRIRFSKEKDKFVGRIAWMRRPNGPDGKPLLDAKNPDEKLRSRAIVGLAVFFNLVRDGNELKDGTAYDYENGKFYRCKAELDGSDTLKIRGYVGISLLGSTFTMKRAK